MCGTSIRAYVFCIIADVLVAAWLTERQYVQCGGNTGSSTRSRPGVCRSASLARLQHVATSWHPCFGPDGDPLRAPYIWEGGMGVWGAIAQGIGRLGNWFDNEVYGGPTDLPWALTIHEWDQDAGKA
ncbi:prolipoprotein diacylglyceryl transferase family protein [Lentzea sp. JNUCC 0626]|uniref:prolipoprotein diacylglyceryl transferase family protein n=1 Tax=Lentzea sp. JNUCC 0626 TaxID=3367513 RepID=UPI003748E842